MGPDEFGVAWQRGTILTLDDLNDLALEVSAFEDTGPDTAWD